MLNINNAIDFVPDGRHVFSELSEEISSRIVTSDDEYLPRSAGRNADSHFLASRPYDLGKMSWEQTRIDIMEL